MIRLFPKLRSVERFAAQSSDARRRAKMSCRYEGRREKHVTAL